MSLFLRRSTTADLESIMLLETSTFVDDAWPVDAMRRELESEHAYYLVAVDGTRDDDPLLGYAGLLAPLGSGQGDIQTIAVTQAARGRGIGRALVQALIGEARRRTVRELFLEVRADNPVAQSLYASLGFEQIGVRRNYYPGGIDANMMRLAVEPAQTSVAASAAATTIRPPESTENDAAEETR